MLKTNTLNTTQVRIYKWINDTLQLSVYADLYAGAAILLKQKPPGYMTFVAHAGRDLMNGLARTVRGDKRRLVPYVNHLDRIKAVWEDRWGASNGFSESEQPSYQEIPRATLVKLQALIDEHRKGQDRSKETNEIFFSTFLNYSDKEKAPENFVGEWKEAKDWFLKHAHARKAIFAREAVTQIEKHFSFLESMLDVAAGSQYERIKGLDEILAETNR